MSKKYKMPLIILVILIIVCLGLLIVKKYVYDKDTKKNSVTPAVVDNMEKYGYALEDRDTKLFKNVYYELKEVLDNDEVDYEKYGEKIATLFLIDLLTISNKVNKYDVGGLDFLYDDEKEMFKNKAMDTIYKDVEDNTYDSRKQELPTVSNIIIDNVDKDTYKINEDKKLESYEYEITIEYKKDLEYDKKVSVTVVKDIDKMYIVKYATIK